MRLLFSLPFVVLAVALTGFALAFRFLQDALWAIIEECMVTALYITGLKEPERRGHE